MEEKKLPDKMQFFENLIAKSTAPEGWMFNKVRVALVVQRESFTTHCMPISLHVF